jgi:hypothetical protein
MRTCCERSRPWVLPALVTGLVLVSQGCGGDTGPKRLKASGKVTFNNRPVPAGRISFEPDASAQNHGPGGFAEIRDGQYDTSKNGKGTVGGPHIVRINGAQGSTPEAAPLFNTFETKADLGKADTTKDFDVPASAAQGLPTTAAPPP